eukprot:CAMPEP_0194512696 /NCGR_PEP_ID=MMETSP0253-20130528/44777_1 /TAXON_ID=2966 /ORGANISM="Noctiluca scintillans" /LENGTH=108 /DNA_ID=CAMNT_0039356181 /DNA_START=447 /DNA_END=773 /DNA_ORIENTATION=+
MIDPGRVAISQVTHQRRTPRKSVPVGVLDNRIPSLSRNLNPLTIYNGEGRDTLDAKPGAEFILPLAVRVWQGVPRHFLEVLVEGSLVMIAGHQDTPKALGLQRRETSN